MATIVTVVALMPVFFVGASGIFMREELSFGPEGLGIAIAAFMGMSAVFGVAGGHLVERIGASRAMRLASLLSGTSLAGIAVLSHSFHHVVLFLALSGCCNSIAQPAGSLALTSDTVARPALMFGVRQSATPLATLLAGIVVPPLSLLTSWRWAFVLGAVLAFTTSMLIPRDGRQVDRARPPAVPRRGLRSSPLPLLAAAMGLGTGAAVALAAFLVEAAVAAGLSAATGGALLTLGSIVGVLVRLVSGWIADRYRSGVLTLTAWMLAFGAAGYGLLAFELPTTMVLGAMLAYGGGWGWPGLIFFAAVRLQPETPAAATGLVAAVGSAGSAIGPLAFGYVVSATSHRMAWGVGAALAVVSALLVAKVQAQLRRRQHEQQR